MPSQIPTPCDVTVAALPDMRSVQIADQTSATGRRTVFVPWTPISELLGAAEGNAALPKPVYHHELAELLAKTRPHGCICPPGSEATCRGLSCPRRGAEFAAR
jgi:hypothetical protein